MHAHRSDRAVRILITLVTIASFLLWAGAILVLVAAPAIKTFAAADNADWRFGLPMRVEMRDAAATVNTRWGGGQIELEDVRASLRLPIPALPWEVFGLLWAYTAAAFALMLLFLHRLRIILQRARDGAAFDPENAGRLRSLGMVALALALLQGAAELLTSLAVRRGLTESSIHVPVGIHIDGRLVVFALLLLTLAEIFRRGAELEHEQSLVV